jgi:arabinosaccharide transport system substrate-binding protein
MSFHLGKPILVMLLIAVVSGAFIASRKDDRDADLVLWVFAEAHAKTYRSIIDEFERETGKTVSIQLISNRASAIRLESMFMSDQKGRVLPDLVEVEIGHVGQFFRPPTDHIGFLPLNDYLQRGGWDKRIVPTRFSAWSKQDVIFGVPHDVHPVSISYRADLFEQAGIQLDQAKTWPEFQEMCLKFQEHWRAQGYPDRHAIELPEAQSSQLNVMLLQRGINVVDQYDKIHINDPKVAQTIAFYAQLIAGPRRIASEAPSGSAGVWTRDLLAGNLCAFMTADWRIYDLQRYAPELTGKMRMMPLPRFSPTDAPTAPHGGTMIGITRNSTRHDDAWKLIEHLYLSRAGLDARLKVTNILPPVIEWWDSPSFHAPDPYFGGQKINELYVELARQLPPTYVTPVTPVAHLQLAVVLSRAVAYIRANGTTDGLEQICQLWLDFVANDLEARVKHGRFEQ